MELTITSQASTRPGPELVAGTQFAYVPQIDAMRALAVVAVMIYHLHPSWLPGGFSGVDVFFVISGYVVSASMAQQRADRFLDFALRFYAKRIRRIVPALVVCLLVTTIITTLFVPDVWLSDSNRKTGFFAFFGMSNLWLMHIGDDYFAPRAEFNPFTHTWSLGVEEQFYLVFPILFYVWIRHHDQQVRWANPGSVLLSLCTLASVAICAVVTPSSPSAAFYLLPTRFWGLGVGALLFQYHSRGRLVVQEQTAQNFILVVALALIAVGFIFSRLQGFPMPWALCSVLGTFGVIACVGTGHAGNTVIGRMLAHPILVFVGKISYSLYLWHWPVFVLFRWTIGLENWRYVLLALALTFALAVVSYYWVENVFRQASALRRIPSSAFVMAGLASLAGSAALELSVFHLQTRLTLSVTRDTELWYPIGPRRPKGNDGECRTTSEHTQTNGTDVTAFLRKNCASAHVEKELYVVGDSHAEAYFSLLAKLSEEKGVQVFIYTQPGCAFLSLYSPMSKAPEKCRNFVQTAVRDIEQRAKTGDVLFLPSLRLERLARQWGALKQEASSDSTTEQTIAEGRKEALLDASNVLRPLVSNGLHVVFEAPTPIFRASLFRCSDWFNQSNPSCAPGFAMSRAFLESYRKPILDALAVLKSAYPGVSIWDPFSVLCPGDPCYAFDEGGPLFYDTDHLSGHGNFVLYSHFLAEMKRHALVD